MGDDGEVATAVDFFWRSCVAGAGFFSFFCCGGAEFGGGW